MTPQVFDEQTLRDSIGLDAEVIDRIADAFTALHEGKAIMPPILRLDIPSERGEVDIKTAYIEGFEGFAVKMSTGFFNNPNLGLPSLGGMMSVLDAKTGTVKAVLLDNGYLTDIRTAAAGAVAARHLAPISPVRVGIIGTGLQARLQLEALALVREIESICVWGRDSAKAKAFADDVPFDVLISRDINELAATSNVIVTTTPTTSALILASDVQPGTHITAMGSDAPDKNELDPAIFEKADLVICDSPSQCEVCGELRSARAAGFKDEVVDLGAVSAGAHPGRTLADQITVCDLTGCGVQDTAISDLAVRRLFA